MIAPTIDVLLGDTLAWFDPVHRKERELGDLADLMELASSWHYPDAQRCYCCECTERRNPPVSPSKPFLISEDALTGEAVNFITLKHGIALRNLPKQSAYATSNTINSTET